MHWISIVKIIFLWCLFEIVLLICIIQQLWFIMLFFWNELLQNHLHYWTELRLNYHIFSQRLDMLCLNFAIVRNDCYLWGFIALIVVKLFIETVLFYNNGISATQQAFFFWNCTLNASNKFSTFSRSIDLFHW